MIDRRRCVQKKNSFIYLSQKDVASILQNPAVVDNGHIPFGLTNPSISLANAGGFTYLTPQDNVGAVLLQGKTWDDETSDVMGRFVTKDYVCVDVGAHVGAYAIPLAKSCKKVYAFEPYLESFACLCANIYLNGVTNLEPSNLAMYDSTCQLSPAPFQLQLAAWGSPVSTCYVERPDGFIHAKPMDDVLGGVNVDFVKIDAQGCDLNVLRGMARIFQESRPRVIFEYEMPLAAVHGAALLDYKAFFDKLGYELAFVRVRSAEDGSGDWLATPK